MKRIYCLTGLFFIFALFSCKAAGPSVKEDTVLPPQEIYDFLTGSSVPGSNSFNIIPEDLGIELAENERFVPDEIAETILPENNNELIFAATSGTFNLTGRTTLAAKALFVYQFYITDSEIPVLHIKMGMEVGLYDDSCDYKYEEAYGTVMYMEFTPEDSGYPSVETMRKLYVNALYSLGVQLESIEFWRIPR